MSDEVLSVKPYVHPKIRSLLERPEFILNLANLHHGPLHLIFPEIMRENIAKMQAFFAEYDFRSKIYFSSKPNKSKVFLREAYKAGINVDVSSYQELVDALSVGFKGTDISCTNSKNRAYLTLAIEQRCIISVDNLSELEQISEILPQTRGKEPLLILLRLSNLMPKDREMLSRPTKFGMTVEELDRAYEIIQKVEKLVLEGFHFHIDNKMADLHAGYIEACLSIIEQAFEKGFRPRVLDIGGGLSTPHLESIRDWEAVVNFIEQALLSNQPTNVWNKGSYGMILNNKGTISRRSFAEILGNNETYESFLQQVLENTSVRSSPLHKLITDYMLTLVVEPGRSLLSNCGISLLTVKGTKKGLEGENLIMVDANTYNISANFIENVKDFILVPQNKKEKENFAGYIIDNQCHDRGLLNKRLMSFEQVPQEGDILVMINTAAYVSDFEEAEPHKHPTGKKLVLEQEQDNWKIYSEEKYLYR